jgi:hypothetical protein
MREKIQTLRKAVYKKVPLQKRARFGPDHHGIVCRNEATLDTRVAIGMARNATEIDFRFVSREVLFLLECQNQVFL